MSFIISYIHSQLMIHFSYVVDKADVVILNSENVQLNSFLINNQDFVNLKLPLNQGIYHVKVVEQEKETIKTIIVNN